MKVPEFRIVHEEDEDSGIDAKNGKWCCCVCENWGDMAGPYRGTGEPAFHFHGKLVCVDCAVCLGISVIPAMSHEKMLEFLKDGLADWQKRKG